VWEEALARIGYKTVRWEGDMLHQKALGGGQLRLVFTMEKHWEIVNKKVQFLQQGNEREFCNMPL